MDEDRNNNPWSVLKRLISGEPAFIDIYDTWKKKRQPKDERGQDGESPRSVEPPPVVPNDPLHDRRGQKIIPEIQYQRYDDHIHGENLDLWLQFKNISTVPIMICRVEIFNTTRRLNQLIKPGEVEQIDAYTGRLPDSTSSDVARIVYNERYSGTSDVFCAEYVIRFSQYHDNKHYTIHRLDKKGPTLDW